MPNLTELKQTLAKLAPDTRFTLDNRSDEFILNALSEYVKNIPFDDTHSWEDILFMAGNDPVKLAQLYEDSAQADGTLLPHQAFMLAILELLKTPRAFLNYFPAAHRELYYRGLLGVQERSAHADSVALTFQLNAATPSLFLPIGTEFDAGKDAQGTAVKYALDQSLLLNQSQWSDLRWVQASDASAQIVAIPYDRQAEVALPDGGIRLFSTQDNQQTVVTGRMVSSSVLAMPSGERTFTLTFATAVDSSTLDVVQVSGGDSWLDLTLPNPATNSTTLVLTLPESAGEIASAQNLDGVTSKLPLLKLGCTNMSSVPAITALSVGALGSSDVAYSTDVGVDRLDARSYPFGTTPVVGSGFNLMAAQWCNPTVPGTLTLTPQWMGLPDEEFATWYAGYDSPPASNEAFKVQPLMVSASGSEALGASQPLFTAGTGTPPTAALSISLPAGLHTPASPQNDPRNWPQWLRLELTPQDFLHEDYLKLAGTAAVNPPYTPQMSSLTVSYSATAQDLSQYLLTPFGYGDASAPDSESANAQLYLGFSGGQPGETLSLYWQLQSPQPLVPEWQYLNQANQWAALDDSVVDGTHGLSGSGLWSATLPHDAASDAWQMPAGRYWLRAVLPNITAPDASGSDYPWLQGLAANGMTATLARPQTLDPRHFIQPLPAGAVARPVKPITGLEQVTQPWPSSGGIPAETTRAFFARVAERLSHRQRALTGKDAAALLKSQFASVFDVAVPTVDALTRYPAAPTQTLLVIPVDAQKDNQDRVRPQLSQSHLNDMAAYLQTLASPWTSFAVINPTYRDVVLAYDVSFNVNEDYGYRQLQSLLTLHFMPWSWQAQSGVALGNTLDYYGIIAWIQQQSFVMQVNSLTLDGNKASVQGNENEVLILTGFAPTPATLHKDIA